MRNSQGREWTLVQDQSQEPQSRLHGSSIGSVDILSEDAWALGLQLMGINFKVPISYTHQATTKTANQL